MSKLTTIAACVVLGAIISLGIWLTFHASDNPAPSAVRSSTIVYDGDHFEPVAIVASSGSKIKFINQSDDTVTIVTDPRSSYRTPELDVGSIDPGVSKTVTITAKGTWGFNNRQQPDQRGTIRIE